MIVVLTCDGPLGYREVYRLPDDDARQMCLRLALRVSAIAAAKMSQGLGSFTFSCAADEDCSDRTLAEAQTWVP